MIEVHKVSPDRREVGIFAQFGVGVMHSKLPIFPAHSNGLTACRQHQLA